MRMRNAIWLITAFVLVLTIDSRCFAVKTDDDYSECYALMEVSTGTVVRENNAGEKVHMGSFNKLMTVLLAAESIERGELTCDTQLVCSEYANSMQGAQIWLMPGEKMTLEELLRAVIIGNANDAACVIAEKLGGSEEKFTEMMNKRASELGMENTLFTNCSGYYDDEKQYTTAYDAALLLCELYKHNELYEMFTTRLDELKSGEVQLVSPNTLAYNYHGAVGFKCGTGPASGYYAAEGAERDSIAFVVAVLDCGDEDRAMALSEELLDIGFCGYTVTAPVIPSEASSSVMVRNGVSGDVVLSVENIGYVLVPKGRENEVELEIILPSAVYAPIYKGERIGELRVRLDERIIKKCSINAAETIEKKNYVIILMNMLKNIVSF